MSQDLTQTFWTDYCSQALIPAPSACNAGQGPTSRDMVHMHCFRALSLFGYNLLQ
jgi:hypothetical protein